MSIVAKWSPISDTAELLLYSSWQSVVGHAVVGHDISPQNCPFPWVIWTPNESNAWFFGSTQLSIPNGISIGSAVFTQFTADSPYTL